MKSNTQFDTIGDDLVSKKMGPDKFRCLTPFMDALHEWLESNEPVPSSLPHLVKILGREINDPDKTNDYKKLIRSHMTPPKGK